VRDLSQVLSRAYRSKESYSAQEVDSMIDRWGLPKRHLICAHALFLTREEFDRLHPPTGFESEYDTIRREVSKRFLGGRTDFTAKDLIAYSFYHWNPASVR
jgi:hypothetical protein